MKAILFAEGSSYEFENGYGFVMNEHRNMVLLNQNGQPLAICAPGVGAIIFPENDTALVRATGLVDGSGEPIQLTNP